MGTQTIGKPAVPGAWAEHRAWVRAGLDPRTWAFVLVGGRDPRLDFIRGYMLLRMIVNHVGGDSVFTAYLGIGTGEFLTGAAEGFVFLAGALVGIVYGKRVPAVGLRVTCERLLRRAGFLYAVVTVLTLASVALFLFTEVPLIKDRSRGLGLKSPIDILVATLTMHFSYNATDIMTLYAQLMLFSPLVMYLLVSGRTRYLLAGSGALWAVYQFFPAYADVPWTVRNSIFPFPAWQLVFYGGMALGFHRNRLGRWSANLARPSVLLALGVVALALIAFDSVYQTGAWATLGLPALEGKRWTFLFGKNALGPGRLFAFVVFAALIFQLVTRFWQPLRFAFGWFLLPLGRNSLLVYGAHLFLAGPVRVIVGTRLAGEGNGLVGATVAQLIVIGLLLLLAKAKHLGASQPYLQLRRKSAHA